jgi:ribose/xylose/arabinose/galactoside ABC-type transport system permease subunit
MGFINQYFLTWDNIANIISSSCPTILAGIGMGMCLLIRGTDLSTGSTIYLAAVVAWKITQSAPGTPLVLLILVSMSVGVVVGLINGYVVAILKIYPLLPTLAMMYIARGTGLWIAGVSQGAVDKSYSVILNVKFLGLPYFVYIVFGLAIIAQIFLSKTKLGRHIYATGDNEKMAKEKGVKVFGIKVFVFALAGTLSGLAAVLSTAMSNNVSYSMGQGFEFRVITACVLGGISLNGGRGTVFPGVVIGALIWRLLYNVLVLLNANQYSYDVVCALAIFVVVLLDTIKTNRLEVKL